MHVSSRALRGVLLSALASGSLALAASLTPLVAQADETPGTIPSGTGTNNDPLAVQVTESGKIYLSTDGLGTNDPAGGNIRAQKPSAGATVRSAYLFAASTGGSRHVLVDGDVILDGQVVTWSIVTPSDISSSNGWANVTSIVKPTLDAAPVGITSFHVLEADTFQIDGEGLAVIWDDPAQTADNTVVLMFGAQNTAGDSFKVLYATPIDKTNPNLVLDMSLGISFGYQQPAPTCTGQFSTIDVNGTRISSSAGGQDDGQGANGALMTVGGIGDTDTGPADPNSSCSPLGDRQDQELYNIVPFLQQGDTTTTIFTHNPSGDDNILFAGFFLKGESAVVGAGIVLSPSTATNDAVLGATHTVTATAQDNNGNPVAGTTVTFTVTAGPNMGASGVCSANVSCQTDASGKVSFTYSSNGTGGTDTIKACFTDATNTLRCATATKTWVAASEQQISAQGVTFSPTEGQSFTGTVATFSDPNPSSTASEYSASIQWGDGTTSAGTVSGPTGGPFTVSGTHTYADEGTYNVAVIVTDVDTPTNTATASSTANVADAALSAGQIFVAGGTEGSAATTASMSFSDANSASTVADFTATVDWGDGTTSAGTVTGPPGGPYTVSGSHTYSEEGSYPVTVKVKDDGGSMAAASGTANVADAGLTASCAAPTNFTQDFNGATAIFTDAASPSGTLSDFSATINWGDGSSSAGTVSGPNGGPYTVTGSHHYASTNNFSITTSITDVGGATATTSCNTIIFAFAPGGGAFVIGDKNSAIGRTVTFWGAQWWKKNSLSGGGAPASFKGFAESPAGPTCSVAWNTDPGNSTPPPSGPLPAYMAVIVTSSTSMSGSEISGNTVHIVIVKTNAGYSPDPGNPGTGTVVAQIC
jgi:hypothetical protein